MLKSWSETTPPRSTWVMASYSVLEAPALTMTCKHGCCVDRGFGSMMLPAYWREATAAEIEANSWRAQQ